MIFLYRSSPFISIHAPREGGDQTVALVFPIIMISIHAPREGGDHRQQDTN